MVQAHSQAGVWEQEKQNVRLAAPPLRMILVGRLNVLGICAAPTGLYTALQYPHRLRSGLLLCCPYGALDLIRTPHRGATTVAHCASGG